MSSSYATAKDSAGAAQKALPKVRRTVVTRVHHAIKAIALCHNVTPVYEDDDNEELENEQPEADQQMGEVMYQASSPDEVFTICCELAKLKGI